MIYPHVFIILKNIIYKFYQETFIVILFIIKVVINNNLEFIKILSKKEELKNGKTVRKNLLFRRVGLGNSNFRLHFLFCNLLLLVFHPIENYCKRK